jgi:diaminopimelate decarboxylase
MSLPLEFFNYQNGVLTSGGVSLENVARSVGTPVYVYSAEAFLHPLRQLQAGLAEENHMICFAVKSNSNIAVLKLLGSQGAGMDLVSGGELSRAQAAGIAANKTVFSGIGKTKTEMSLALQYQNQGIFSFNVESIPELHSLNEVARDLNKKARVALRFNPDVNPRTHPYISTGLKKNKFGMNRKEILQLVGILEKEFRWIELHGISIHIGSQLLSLSPLRDAFDRVQTLIDEVNSKLKQPLRFVDLGGGLGITYQAERTPSLEKYCELICKYFGKRSPYKGSLKILLEPGRTISGNAGILLTEVLYRKERKQKDFLILDAGMNDLIRPALYESYHGVVPLFQESARDPKRKVTLVGPVCESADCFAEQRLLPSSLKKGDCVAILSSGAYGFSMASNYNSRPRPAEVLIQDGKFRVIRERESYEDLLRGEIF